MEQTQKCTQLSSPSPSRLLQMVEHQQVDTLRWVATRRAEVVYKIALRGHWHNHGAVGLLDRAPAAWVQASAVVQYLLDQGELIIRRVELFAALCLRCCYAHLAWHTAAMPVTLPLTEIRCSATCTHTTFCIVFGAAASLEGLQLKPWREWWCLLFCGVVVPQQKRFLCKRWRTQCLPEICLQGSSGG